MESPDYDLTALQRDVLQHACVARNGIASLPLGMRQARLLGAMLVARGLMIEVDSQSGWPIWQRGPNERPISLKITRRGRRAARKGEGRGQAVATAYGYPSNEIANRAASGGSAPRDRLLRGLNRARALSLLARHDGTTIAAVVEATGWLPHTARARLTELRQLGFDIERRKGATTFTYRLVIRRRRVIEPLAGDLDGHCVAVTERSPPR